MQLIDGPVEDVAYLRGDKAINVIRAELLVGEE